jgi:hypothetical protein
MVAPSFKGAAVQEDSLQAVFILIPYRNEVAFNRAKNTTV